jgi:NADH:ubiquinone oxidoreductase subunit K
MLFVNYSFILDDLIGASLSLLILPLAGAESAMALAVLVAYAPLRGGLNIS